MKLQFCFFLILGLLIASCAASVPTSDFDTYESHETPTTMTETEIPVAATTTITAETETDGDIDQNIPSDADTPSFVSPNGKYALTSTSVSYQNNQMLHYDLSLTDIEHHVTLAALDETVINISVAWSSDSRYAAITFGPIGYGRDIIIADVQNKQFQRLPDIDEIKQNISESNLSVAHLESSYKYVFFLDDWLDDEENLIQITFSFGDPNFSEPIVGQYRYDLAELQITELNAENDSIENIPPHLIP